MTDLRERLGRLPLRVRLVAGFSAAMLVLLTGAGAFVYWRVEYALDRGLDTELTKATAVITPLVTADGTVSSREAASATGAGWQVLDDQGRVLDAGGPAPQNALVASSRLSSGGTLDVGSFLPASDAPYRVRISTLAPAGGPASYLLVGVRRDHRDEALRELLLQLSLAGLAALVIASVVGDLLARSALRPVERYRRRADEIAAGAPDLRLDVPPGRDDEVTRLGHTLNQMLAALQESLDRERHFVNDASHELRTPLTLLRSRIQLARRRARSVEEHERVLDELAVDVTRLADLAEQLLAMSHQPGESGDACDLTATVHHVVQRLASAWPDRADEVTVKSTTTPVTGCIDPSSFERIVTNLLDNALTHGQPPVLVQVRTDGSYGVLEVSDAGPGMPAELLAHATRRFSRAPEARARPGAGLGLSIVEQLVVATGGELRLCYAGHHSSSGADTRVHCRHDEGMTVTVILPATSS